LLSVSSFFLAKQACTLTIAEPIASFASAIAELASELASFVSELAANASVYRQLARHAANRG
jgi:hypothetical protein